jgi:hypothetical protein
MKGAQNQPNDLDRIQKLILYSLCRATGGGKKAHVPKPYFMSRPELQGHRANKAFRELVALNYIIRHQTAGGETFELDARGLEMCRKLREQMKAL